MLDLAPFAAGDQVSGTCLGNQSDFSHQFVNSRVDAPRIFSAYPMHEAQFAWSPGRRGVQIIKPITTEVTTLGDLLVRAAGLVPERAAIILPDQRASYAALNEGAWVMARALLGMGVRPGEHVGLLVPNCVEFAEALFAISMLGCVAVPLNARHKSGELSYIIENADLAALLTSRHAEDPVDFPTILAEALSLDGVLQGNPIAAAPKLRHIALVRGEESGCILGREAFLARAEGISDEEVEQARLRVQVRGPAIIIYTSGTTANPKGCVLSHEAVTRGPVERARHRLGNGGHEVTWAAGPLFHIGSLAPFIGSIGVAGTFLSDIYFEPGRAVRLMRDHGVTLAWPWFSAIVQGVITHPSFNPADFKALRHLFLIGPPILVEKVQSLLPHTEVLQACGMTETAGVFALADRDELPKVRCVTHGKPSPGVEVLIVDPDSGREQPPDVMGEIWVRGYNVMDGYWRAPDKTAEALTSDGWLRTGDLYTRLSDGNLVFGGRLKDMLKVGGENVAAVEVEAFLCTHPAVRIAEVVGRPDPRLDEVPVAFVELHEGRSAAPEAIIEHCRGRIASYKVPREVHILSPDEWPMSATKVDKRALRERLSKTVHS